MVFTKTYVSQLFVWVLELNGENTASFHSKYCTLNKGSCAIFKWFNFLFLNKSSNFSYSKNMSASELPLRWHMVLPHPSDTRGMPKDLGDPRECAIRHDSWRREGWQKLQHRYQGGRKTVLEFRVTPYLSLKSTKMLLFICPGEDSIAGMKVSLREGLDSPRQTVSRTLNSSVTDRVDSVSALQSCKFSVTRHKLLPAL